MKSEKVKEIKKALEQNIKSGLGYEDNDKFCNIMFADILTLINELESDNESCHEVLVCLKAIIKQQNDRIAELETKNEVLCVELSRYTEHCVEMKNGTLKQFAERLKKKGKSTYDFFQCPTKENKVISFDDINETLKEFIDG